MEKKIICEFCDKTFTRTYGLTCHLKKCKRKKKQELVIQEKDNEIQELKDMVEKLLLEKGNTITNNNTNNSYNTTNNMTNNIIIHNNGDEDTKYITRDYILNL